jgi:hypothetical protein
MGDKDGKWQFSVLKFEPITPQWHSFRTAERTQTAGKYPHCGAALEQHQITGAMTGAKSRCWNEARMCKA